MIIILMSLITTSQAQVITMSTTEPAKGDLAIKRYQNHEPVFDQKIGLQTSPISVQLNGSGFYVINNTPVYLLDGDDVKITFATKENRALRLISNLEGKSKQQNLLFYELDRRWQKYALQTVKLGFELKRLSSQINGLNRYIDSCTQDKNLNALALYYNQLNALGSINGVKDLSDPYFAAYIAKIDPKSALLGLLPDVYTKNFLNQYYALQLKLQEQKVNKFKVMDQIARNFKPGRILDDMLKDFLGYEFRFYGLSTDMQVYLPSFKQKITSPELLKKIGELQASYEKILRGKKSPDFVLQDVNGKAVKLSDFKGKVVTADIWATWCSVCIEKMPEFLKLRESYKSNPDVVFLTISIDEDFAIDQWKTFLKKNGMTGRELIALGPGGKQFRKDFNINVVPKYLIINQAGEIVLSYGAFDAEYIKLLAQTIKGK